MRRSFEAYLWDIQDRGTNILKFIGSSSEDQYVQNEFLRSAVERNLEIIGEAIVQAKRHFPDRISQITGYGEVISFRNELAHGYDGLNHHQVWTVIKDDLPKLLGEVSALLQQSPPRA